MTAASVPRRAPKLVAVDDDPLVRRTLSEFFRENGYTFAVVEDGVTGLEAIHRERPDVVVLDNVLPDLGFPAASTAQLFFTNHRDIDGNRLPFDTENGLVAPAELIHVNKPMSAFQNQ